MKTKSVTLIKKMNALKIICLVAVSLLFITSCSKDQKIAKQLDGTWKVDKIIPKIGSAITDSLPTLSFTKCKVKKTTCTGIWKSFDGSSVEFEWDIEEKGKDFWFGPSEAMITGLFNLEKVASEASIYVNYYDIVENSKTNFIITTQQGSGTGAVADSLIVTIEMSKQ